MNRAARHLGRRLLRRIGRRGASLLFVGMLSAVLAASLWFLPAEQAASPGFQVLATIAPLPAWSAGWALVAAACFIQAFVRQDRLAFSVAAAMWWLYGLAYIIGVATGQNPRGWVAGLIWIGFGGWLTLISTWSENIDLRGTSSPPGPSTGPIPAMATISADGKGRITGFNAAAEELFGWTGQQVMGQPLTLLMPQRFRAEHQSALDRVRRTGQSRLAGQILSLTALHRTGREFPIELTINVWDAPEGPAFTGVIRPPIIPGDAAPEESR